MIQLSASPESIKALLTLLILAGAIYGFISEKVSPDVTAVLALLALLITGILTPAAAFSRPRTPTKTRPLRHRGESYRHIRQRHDDPDGDKHFLNSHSQR